MALLVERAGAVDDGHQLRLHRSDLNGTPMCQIQSLLTRGPLTERYQMCAQMLLDLAAHMECIGPLREEVEDAVERHGWSPKALSELPKLDSFMRESNRYHAPARSLFLLLPRPLACNTYLSTVPMTRLAMRDHMFSNGITVPKGTFVSISSTMHFDDNVYEHANEFLPFRHIEKAKETGETAKHQFISTSADYGEYTYALKP